MGSSLSMFSEDAKIFKEMTNEEMSSGESPGSVTTPENNAVHQKVAALVDPRSPTQGVSRTPLEIEERNKRIERTRLKNQFNKENNLTVPLLSKEGVEHENVTTPTGPSSKEFPPGFDPRSPNPEINRTPIAVNQHAPVVGRKMFQNQENTC